ncbi:MAG: DNA polymerase III subunit delta [Ruminococcaceae bacterium]|nr:DNA polymerase III subunit delta [Oscillospiraceae bacterium]
MKEIISEVEFRKRLAKSPAGGYLFFGDEDYLKLHALKSAAEVACPDPSMAVFNHMTVDLSLTSASADELYSRVSSALSASPMMADTKLVVLTGLFPDELRAAEVEALCSAISLIDEFDFNLFIVSVSAGMLDPGRLPKKPSAILSKLCEHLVGVNFEPVAESKLAAWVLRHFKHRGVNVCEGVTAALFSRCGRNMFTLAGEIEKLCGYVLENGRDYVTVDDVAPVVCLTEEFDPFALTTAVASGNSALALRILATEKAQKTDPIIILGGLSRTLSDMLAVKLLSSQGIPPKEIATALRTQEFMVNRYVGNVRELSVNKLAEAVRLCAEADASLKLSGSGYTEIERLICAL